MASSQLAPLKFAVMDNRVDMANLLIDAGASAKDADDARSMLNLCTVNDSVEMLECLFKTGILDLLEFNDVAYQMHRMASGNSHGLLCACLDHAVENEADLPRLLAHKDSRGQTLLLNAVTSQGPVNILTVKLLIRHGADVLEVSEHGQTVEELLRLNRGSDNQEIIDFLHERM
jgi:ankyrin repeat protein